jgi:predicted ATP-grasp superfamily ATP-dependent carboligase
VAIGWQGIFECEQIERQDGGFGVIDLNPRLYGSLALANAAGAPLPVLWCDWLLRGRVIQAPRVARPGHYYRREDADLGNLLSAIRERRFHVAASITRPRRRTVHAFFRWSDPGPLLAQVVFLVRRASRRRRGG